jgi:hypothetical protein
MHQYVIELLSMLNLIGLSIFLVVGIFLFTPSPLERNSGDDFPSSTLYNEQRVLNLLPAPAVAAAASSADVAGG